MSTDSRALGHAAANLAASGVRVFPCVPGGKAPLTRHGYLDATTELAEVHEWWTRWPLANIGMPTGDPGYDVLDVDVRASGSGFAALSRLRPTSLVRGWATAVRTPSGGLHLYYAGTDQRCASMPGCHLDLRARGGYVVVPPSKINWSSYQVIAAGRETPARLDWATVREQLVPATDKAPSSRARASSPTQVSSLAAWVERQPEGNRNRGLYWAACRLASVGLDPGIVLLEAGVRAGLSLREATITIASARRRFGSAGDCVDPPQQVVSERHTLTRS
jgi:hypothetical protein